MVYIMIILCILPYVLFISLAFITVCLFICLFVSGSAATNVCIDFVSVYVCFLLFILHNYAMDFCLF